MLKYHLLSHKFPVLGEGNDFHKITEFASSDRSKTNVTQCPVPVCLFRSKHTGYNAASLVYLLQDQEHSQVVRRTPEKLPPPSLHWISLGTNRISSKPGFSIALYCLRMTLQCIAECLFLLLLFLFWLPFCCYLIIFYLSDSQTARLLATWITVILCSIDKESRVVRPEPRILLISCGLSFPGTKFHVNKVELCMLLLMM